MTRATLSLTVLLAALHPAMVARGDDHAELAGLWDVVAVESDGRQLDGEIAALLQVSYREDGSWAVLFSGLAVGEGTSRHDHEADPKRFEMETRGGEATKPCTYTGIYRVDGDSRQLCFVEDGSPRPDAFTAPRGSERVLVTLRRAARR